MHEPHDRSDIRYKFTDFDTWQFPVREVARAAVFLRAQAESILESACGVLECDVPLSIEEKKAMLFSHHIAVWDVIQSCEIEGSSDASIRDVVPNDLTRILNMADIRAIYTNGGKAHELYCKYIEPVNGIEAQKLPSTSPANAGYSLERLLAAWSVIRENL